MSDSVRPHRQHPTRLPLPWDSPGKNTGVGCHFLLQCMKVKSLSCVRLLATTWTAAHQAPPSMGFSRQEYWNGVPLPSPVDDDCSCEIKRRLLLGRKVMTNLDGILKSRDITLPKKVHLVKAMVFPIVMYGCESWTIKKADNWSTDAFKLWCWRRLLTVLWLQGDQSSWS